MNLLNSVTKAIPAKHKNKVECVEIDSDCVEVILKSGFINDSNNETIWSFAIWNIESREYTIGEMKQDLKDWLNDVVPCE